MREPIKDKGRLEHILQSITNLQDFSKGKTLEDIQNDNILYYALVKNIEIIGEAAYMLSIEFKNSHTGTNWRDIISMRHVLVHGYYAISPGHVWAVIEHDLEPLKQQIVTYLAELS
ncbi:MAG: DUF86 domain-containing protein [Paludibacteraceae bacterium]|nr:DUF86 domain-containing protein [Paludibacteraceae bacterium]